jgi:peptidyl-prolyl cis-trans isomerase B (cyclophilin B)
MRSIVFSILLSFITTLSFATENKMPTPKKVKLTTTLGQIVIQLNTEKAPVSSENFLTYVKDGFYNGTIFHRVIKGFMAQGGGFDTHFTQKTTRAAIKNEADNGLANNRGTIAMARIRPELCNRAIFYQLSSQRFFKPHQPYP